MLTVKSIEELQADLKIHGRTTNRRNPLTLFWTGSGIECNVSGSELWIEIEVTYQVFEPWMSVTINEAPIARFMLQKGRYWVCLFRGMNPDVVKNVRIFKDLQAMSDDGESFIHIWNVKCDGEFSKVADKELKIEFIGDSITSGEGAIGAVQEEDWIPMFFSSIRNYAYMVAKKLDADYRVISQSGWGIYSSWDGNPHNAIPPIYEKICGLMQGKMNEELGGMEPNDFKSWQPDFVMVNLGTNDDSAFKQEPFWDEKTQQYYKQRVAEDGTYHPEDIKKVHDAICDFLKTIRKNNPKAKIIWIYGMLGLQLEQTIQKAMEAYKTETKDEQVYYLRLQETNEDTVGARSHPGFKNHELAANIIVDFINEKFERK